MTRLKYDVVDVFSDVPFAGNQLAVVHGAETLDDEAMLAITREFNFSEVTFPQPIDEASYQVRIWTKSGEVPFAGHPTLGTAFVLRSRGLLGAGPVVQHSPVGETVVSFEGGTVTLAAPPREVGDLLPDEVVHELLSRVGLTADDAAGSAVVAGTGLNWLHLRVRPGAVERSRPLTAPITDLVPELAPRGVNLYAISGDQVRSRVFTPLASGEDPGTGSAAAGLGLALAVTGVLPTDGRYQILQGVELGRPSRLFGHTVVQGGVPVECRVSGAVAFAMSGQIVVPAHHG